MFGTPSGIKFGLFAQGKTSQRKEAYRKWKGETFGNKSFKTQGEADKHLAALGNPIELHVSEFVMI